jgi:hypothetical protein
VFGLFVALVLVPIQFSVRFDKFQTKKEANMNEKRHTNVEVKYPNNHPATQALAAYWFMHLLP